jgi:hypothetical protein
VTNQILKETCQDKHKRSGGDWEGDGLMQKKKTFLSFFFSPHNRLPPIHSSIIEALKVTRRTFHICALILSKHILF